MGRAPKPHQATLLVVDDDPMLLDSLVDWLADLGYRVLTATSRVEALAAVLAPEIDLVLADIRLGDGEGFEVLEASKRVAAHRPVILMTGYGTVETGVEAVRAGAFDLLTKPIIDDELLLTIDRALAQTRVLSENARLKKELDQSFRLDNVVGRDKRMRQVYEMIEAVSDTKATILITGESGTGKSLIARAIHRASPRKTGPFVEVACGALPETLLESELFGHVAGAFTGATHDKRGKFLQADGGTIFLDEIATATASLQVKLLRVLQDFEFEAVGGTTTHRVNTRVVLATNENLEDAVREGRFRQDLFYRVNVINIELPALRDRVDDLPFLAEHFLKKTVEETSRNVTGFSPTALDAMRAYAWPGNVRELQNVVERTVLLARGSVIELSDLPSSIVGRRSQIETPFGFFPDAPTSSHRGYPPSVVGAASLSRQASSTAAMTLSGSWTIGTTLKEALAEPERQIIVEALRLFKGNRNETADALGINRTTLYKKMKKLGLEETVTRSW